MLDEDEVIVDEAAGGDGLSGVANTACPLTGKSLNEIDDPVMYVAFSLHSLCVCVCVCVCVMYIHLYVCVCVCILIHRKRRRHARRR